MKTMPCTLKELAYHLKLNKESGYSTALLVGAGVSVTAGIPLANTMVDELIAMYPGFNLERFKGDPNAYNEVMRSIPLNQRETFLRDKISRAKINSAHFFIGSLVSQGYVDCILTTNFDSLLIKTLALYNLYPAVYDLANTKKFLPSSISYPNIFYLHGQGTAFRMLNTMQETKEATEYFKALFDHLDKKHTWIVVGYSGETDFVFKGLTEQNSFYNNLYWVGRKPEAPKHVSEQMGIKESVRYMTSKGADTFFRDLSNELDLPLPGFVEKPFSHLRTALEQIGDLEFESDAGKHSLDILKQPFLKIDKAISTIEAENKKPITELEIQRLQSGEMAQKMNELFALGKYSEIIDKRKEILDTGNDDLKEILAQSYLMLGNEKMKDNIDAGIGYYSEAIHILPQMSEAWYNWGTALLDKARIENDEAIYHESFEKFKRSLEIKESADAWHNWGYALNNCARSKGGDEKLYNEAIYKFDKAIALSSDSFESFDAWGFALMELGKKQNNDEQLFNQALEKMEQCNAIKPHFASYNIACLYSLTGDKTRALDFLRHALEHKTMNLEREEIETDEDLKNIWGLPDFIVLLDTYRPFKK